MGLLLTIHKEKTGIRITLPDGREVDLFFQDKPNRNQIGVLIKCDKDISIIRIEDKIGAQKK